MKKKIFSIMAVISVVLFLGAKGLVGQDEFLFTQKELNDFKLAKRHHYTGEQLFIKGKHQKAEKSFKKCLNVFPKYSSADYYLSKICYQKTDYIQALAHIEKAEKNFRFMDNLNVSAQWQYLKRLREERENLQNVLNDPNQKLTDSMRSELEKKVRRIDDAVKRPIPSADHIPADYHYVHGNILFKMKKFKEAYGRYVETLKSDPRHANAYNNLISLLHMVKQYKKALAYIEQAEANGVEVNPKLKEAVLKGQAK